MSSANSSQQQKPRAPRVVANYQLGKTLGQGSMGKVKVATRIDTSEQFACKIINRPVRDPASSASAPIAGPTRTMSKIPNSDRTGQRPLTKHDQDDQRIIREMAITLILDHPHIVPLRDIIVSNDFYFLFYEFVDGPQLLDFIISHGRLKEKFARRFMRQIISAVDYCHQHSIVHRDLKIENILIDKRGHIKLIDFGLSNIYNPSSLLSTFCGSLYFAAPELLGAKKYVGPEVDVWSMGVILYVLVCGRVPFDDTSLPALHAKIKAGVVDYPAYLSEDLVHLISRMLVLNPLDRITVQDLKSHPWITKDHDGPPKNYVPERDPITLPLDTEVINEMCGFEFGTPEDIHDKLMTAISEPAVPAPLDAMHPLIKNDVIKAPQYAITSIYQLIKQKLDRERAKRITDAIESPISTTPLRITIPTSVSQQVPQITIKPALGVDTEKYHEQRSAPVQPNHPSLDRTQSRAPRSATSATPADELSLPHPVSPISPSSIQSPVSPMPSPITQSLLSADPMHRRAQSFSNRKRPSYLAVPASPTPSGTDSVTSGASMRAPEPTMEDKEYTTTVSVFGTFSRRSSRQHESADMDRVNQSTGRKDTRHTKPSRLDTSVTRRDDAVSDADGTLRPDPKNVVTSLFASMARARRGRDSPVDSIDTSSGSTSMDSASESPRPVVPGRIDDVIDNVYFKGLFTVANTSALHPTVIRHDLVRVLRYMSDHYGVMFSEHRGVLVVDFRAPKTTTSLAVFKRRGVRVPKLMVSTTMDRRASGLASGLDDDGLTPISVSESSSTGNSPTPWLGVPTTPDPSSRTSTSTPPSTIPQRNISKPTPHTPLQTIRFEIRLCKITWRGLYGIQFHRVGGDSWQYKQMCQTLLELLRV